MKIIDICKMLEIQSEVVNKLLECEKNLDFESMEQEIEGMRHPECWEGALERLRLLLGDDEDGMNMLSCQLRCACEVYDKYQELGIPKEIFISTMKFFPRFLQDYKDNHGSYRYVWGWWAVHQLSMVEYRIGELEYEMRMENDSPLINIHIPADADITLTKLRRSYLEAVDFFKRYYPEFMKADMVCSSWLLAPSLKHVLPESSRIMQFQKSFEVQHVEEDSLAFMDWVYGTRDIPLEKLPEDTSLQKKLKPYLLNKGKIEWASGKLILGHGDGAFVPDVG
ncbi:acyltransferase domain-containing protein [Clostridium manihotivorum]|uniref:GNAT-like C-terminal domain-containing protein n=1 Tax=Clostridium manihotivorum TaxID=2320868 RepID=A0A3R5QQP0_9CLOT|nr:acyltransferase domain-containing protein [Clostridium manihotivorum]QAA30474.1 hypothetical protein C1I91_01655 [Clostridium manihotivorum]